MWDRRVVRGNTYAAVVSKKNDQTQTKPKSPTKQTKSAIKIVIYFTPSFQYLNNKQTISPNH